MASFSSASHGTRCQVCNDPLNTRIRPRRLTCGRSACTTEYRKRALSQPTQRSCAFCGRGLSPAWPDTVCSAERCREDLEIKIAELRNEDERLRRKQEAIEFAGRQEVELRERLGETIPVTIVRAVLPANTSPLAPLDSSRRDQFAQGLEELVRKAATNLDQPLEESVGIQLPATGLESLSGAACAACNGHCCRGGGNTAYLTVDTICRYLLAHPEQTPEQVIEAYASKLPSESVVNSCLFHSKTGCGLSRDMRSDTCNKFRCDELKELRATLPENHPPPVLAMMFEGGDWARTVLLEEKGPRMLAEAAPPDGSSP